MDLSTFENSFYFWLSCVVQFFIPFVLLLAMNSVIIHTLRTRSLSFKRTTSDQGKIQGELEGHAKNECQGNSQFQSQSQQGQIFAILLLVAFSFLILITPLYAFNVYISVFDYTKTPQRFAFFYMFYEIVVKLYFTNNAINFFLYVISGQKFRNDLKRLFKLNKETLRKR